jgi:nucleoid DNA-binding protein
MERTLRRYFVVAMKRVEIARRFAARNHVTRAEARDQVGEAVRKILKSLRRGQPVELPGIGRLVAGPRPFEKSQPYSRPSHD